MNSFSVFIGYAGWSIRKEYADRFPSQGTHLERYAQCLNAVEIDSSFHRPHRPATYARWAAAVPQDFRFAVKIPQEITHERRLVNAIEPLERFLAEAQALGEKLGPLLIQLPPGLPFHLPIAEAFLQALRQRFSGDAVCEPRHPSWFGEEVAQLLRAHQIARVAADPAITPQAARPGGWMGLAYYRLHGSPQTYVSAYSDQQLEAMARVLAHSLLSRPTWCIFDNTATGAATANALHLTELMQLGCATQYPPQTEG